MAGLAGVLDRLAHAIAGRAGPFDGKKALLGAHLAHARTGRAGLGFGPAFGTRPTAGSAGHGRWNVDGLLHSCKSLFQRDPQIVAKVIAAGGPRATTATTAAHHVAKKVVEHVREGRGKVSLAAETPAGSPAATAHAAFKGGVAIAVVCGLLVRVLQDVISLVDFLELRFSIRIVGIAVGVKFFRLLAIALLDLVGACAFGDPEQVIVVLFCHARSSPCRTEKTSPPRFGAGWSMFSVLCPLSGHAFRHRGLRSRHPRCRHRRANPLAGPDHPRPG